MTILFVSVCIFKHPQSLSLSFYLTCISLSTHNFYIFLCLYFFCSYIYNILFFQHPKDLSKYLTSFLSFSQIMLENISVDKLINLKDIKRQVRSILTILISPLLDRSLLKEHQMEAFSINYMLIYIWIRLLSILN